MRALPRLLPGPPSWAVGAALRTGRLPSAARYCDPGGGARFAARFSVPGARAARRAGVSGLLPGFLPRVVARPFAQAASEPLSDYLSRVVAAGRFEGRRQTAARFFVPSGGARRFAQAVFRPLPLSLEPAGRLSPSPPTAAISISRWRGASRGSSSERCPVSHPGSPSRSKASRGASRQGASCSDNHNLEDLNAAPF